MTVSIVNLGKAIMRKGVAWLNQKFQQWTRPTNSPMVLETIGDLMRPKTELVLENVLLRQQVIILQRQVKRPKITNADRRILVLLASRLHAWRSALLVINPETLFQWHRDLFKLVWRRKSRSKVGRPRLAPEVIALIKQIAKENLASGS